MPHLTVEYTANLEPGLDVAGLLAALHAVAADIAAFPLAGLRTRAERRDHFLVADAHPDNAFVHLSLRIAHGRSLEVKQAAAERLYTALNAYLAPLQAQRPLAVSFEVNELDPLLNFKDGNIRDYLARRRTD